MRAVTLFYVGGKVIAAKETDHVDKLVIKPAQVIAIGNLESYSGQDVIPAVREYFNEVDLFDAQQGGRNGQSQQS